MSLFYYTKVKNEMHCYITYFLKSNPNLDFVLCVVKQNVSILLCMQQRKTQQRMPSIILVLTKMEIIMASFYTTHYGY